MSRNPNTPQERIVRRIGVEQPNLALWLGVWLLSFLALLEVGQTVIAARLGFNPSLGREWHGLYAPFAGVYWYLLVAQPFNAIFGKPILIYPAPVVATIRLLPMVGFAVAIGSVIVTSIVGLVTVKPSRPEDEDDLTDSGATWANEETAREDELLDSKCGPVLGGFEVAGKIRLLRYPGEQGGSYTAPPGDWKSLFIGMNSLIHLQHEEAWKWSEEERRLHPWGEEPISLRFDPKFEYWRNYSGGESAPAPQGLGKRALLLAPNGVPHELKVNTEKIACYNPAWFMGIGTDSGVQDALIAADSIISTAAAQGSNASAHSSHWDRATLGFGAAVWEKLGFYAFNRARPEMFSLPGFYDFISSFPSLDAMIEFMLTEPDDPLGVLGWTMLDAASGEYQQTQVKPSIISAARQMQARDIKERSAIYSTLVAYMVKYSSDSLRRYITRCTFGFADLANDPHKATVVDLGFEAMDGTFLQPYLRQMVRSMLRDLTRAGTASIDGRSVRPHLRPWILNIDEANILQYVEEFEMASGFIRGYGGYLWLIWQAEDGQLFKWYTEKTPIKETLGWRLYGAPKLVKTAKPIEEELGTLKRPLTIGNSSGDRFSINPLSHIMEQTQLVDVPLMSAKKLTQMKKPNYIGFVNGHNYYLHKSPVFKIKMLRDRMKIPYVRECEDCYEGKYPYFIEALRDKVASSSDWNAWMDYVREASGGRELGSRPIYPSADVSGEAPAEAQAEARPSPAEERPAPGSSFSQPKELTPGAGESVDMEDVQASVAEAQAQLAAAKRATRRKSKEVA